ncbi:MAG TPA: hypothetical protein VFL16_13280 [Steroidobacteraceae bacterium]|nr:hypothetical protein [Steroidobacteraceae bacterium]
MFVNDTVRLPESGRVCVMGFRADASQPATYYSVQINAARAEVEPMGEPRNPAHVLGVGGRIESAKGPVFAAYFAGSRERFDAQPNYQNGLYVLVDGAVYSVRGERVSTAIRRGITTREFTLSRGDRPQRSVEYRWPVFRGNSGDFLSTLSEMVRTYG